MAAGSHDGGHRTLKVKCATWDQVEAFITRKVSRDGRLPMRVPFTAMSGDPLDLALELPSRLVVSIEGEVASCEPATDGKRSSMVLRLSGLTADLRRRLQALIDDGRGEGSSPDAAPDPGDEPPGPIPTDVPVDELVEPPAPLDPSSVLAEERSVFDRLQGELKRLRESAAHETLGVSWDSDVAAIRGSYFGLTKQFHPDVYARYQSRAIRETAQEIFIHINRAYDRMRDAAVESGSAIAAGPALLPHTGWLVADFDDLGAEPETPLPGRLPERTPRARSSPGIAIREPVAEEASPEVVGDAPLGGADLSGPQPEASEEPALASGEALTSARELLATGDLDKAREVLARALRESPRERSLRALYHVASGYKLIGDGQGARAIAQFEAALAHDRDCAEAREALDRARGGGKTKKDGLFKRLFR